MLEIVAFMTYLNARFVSTVINITIVKPKHVEEC